MRKLELKGERQMKAIEKIKNFKWTIDMSPFEPEDMSPPNAQNISQINAVLDDLRIYIESLELRIGVLEKQSRGKANDTRADLL